MDRNENTRKMCKVILSYMERAMCHGLQVASIPVVPSFLLENSVSMAGAVSTQKVHIVNAKWFHRHL